MPSLTPSELERYIDLIKIKFNIDWINFVETGTYTGECVYAMEDSGRFKNIYTIELHPPTLEVTKNKRPNSSVNFYLGDSRELMPDICKALSGPSIFWLDAHQHHVDMAGANWSKGQYAPLTEELKAITKNFHKEALVIIDDIDSMGTQSLKMESVDNCLSVVQHRLIGHYQDSMRLVLVMDRIS